MKGFTYDGAAANYCFSPNPRASGIDALERSLRKAVNEIYKKQAEIRCVCHRFVKNMEHCYNDSGNEASDIFKDLMENTFSFFNMSASQKNEQELHRVQEEDVVRVGLVKGDIGVPKTRSNYNARTTFALSCLSYEVLILY